MPRRNEDRRDRRVQSTWEVKARKQGDVITGLATVTFKFADFGMSRPNIAGFVTVQD